MSKNNIVQFYAMHHADSKATDSFCCIVEKGEYGGYSGKQWFGNKYCSYIKTEDVSTIVIVSAPEWLLEKKGIINLIQKLQDDKAGEN